VVRCGHALAVERAVDPGILATAVREGRARTGEQTITVDAPSPSPVHEHVGCIRPGMGLRHHTALARAGRTRGLSTPYDGAIADVREELAELETGSARTDDARRAAARAQADRGRLREAVAAARGRLEAAREGDGGTEAAAAALEDAIRQLSEAETDAAAARERLEQVRTARRVRRDRRDSQFRLEDRLANLERDARAHLADAVRDAYREALAAVPGGSREPPREADPVTAALAVARVAECNAPLVLACGRFDSPGEASDVLEAPVLKVQVG
jgi:exonuclease VII small subunit